MFSQHYIPALPLSEFVESFWLYENGVQPHALERILPTGSLAIIINLRDDSIRTYDRHDATKFQSYGGALMVGAHSEYSVIDTACQAAVLGIEFKHGGAFPFLQMPADELRDLHVPLDMLWKADGANLRARLLEAPTPDAKFQILERWLLARASAPLVRHPAVAFALEELGRRPGNRTVADVTEQIGLSSKRFIDVFRAEVGLTPKLYCRILRFQDVLRQIRSGKRLEWAHLALSCGYFDQAHFAHDFRAFAGMTPTAYAMVNGLYQNHVPLID